MPDDVAQAVPFSRRPLDGLALLLLGPAAVIGLLAVVLSLVDVGAYARFIAEDGPVEYGSSLLWLSAAIVGVASLAVLRRRRGLALDRVTLGAYAVTILFFVVAGGEEISWGQRLIGFQPPDQLLEVNKQREANVHNIGSISIYANAFFALTFGLFVLLPIVQRRNRRVRDYLQRHRLPMVDRRATAVYVVVLAVWVFLGVRFGTLGFHPFSLWGHYTQMDDEVFELGAAYAFVSFCVCDLARRLGESPAAAAQAPIGAPARVAAAVAVPEVQQVEGGDAAAS